jgi:hypothetical protein
MARVALPLLFVLAGCAERPPYGCTCTWSALGHPTMSPAELTTSAGARVRTVSEGAIGTLGEPVRE